MTTANQQFLVTLVGVLTTLVVAITAMVKSFHNGAVAADTNATAKRVEGQTNGTLTALSAYNEALRLTQATVSELQARIAEREKGT